MPAGKLSAQSGHAYTDSLMAALKTNPVNVEKYRNLQSGGSKVTLKAKNENQIIQAYIQAHSEGIPCALIIDQGHIFPPFFDGSPIITALGIGPCKKEDIKHITKKFQCI